LTTRAISKGSSEKLAACRWSYVDFRRNPRKNGIVQEYVLPDFSPKSTSRTGYIRSGPNAAPPDPVSEAEQPKKKAVVEGEEEQVLFMGNERFLGSELLFNPSDAGEE
jgi:actin-related protein 6